MAYMPSCKGYWYIIIAHCDLSGWIKAKPLHTLSSWAVADFLWEDSICCHGCFRKLIINGSSENKNIVAKLMQKYRVKKVVVSANHLQINKIIERGHKPIFNSFSKLSNGRSTN